MSLDIFHIGSMIRLMAIIRIYSRGGKIVYAGIGEEGVDVWKVQGIKARKPLPLRVFCLHSDADEVFHSFPEGLDVAEHHRGMS